MQEHAQQYLSYAPKNGQEKWQVARNFVTNMIELNNNIIQKTIKIPGKLINKISIRFLQPAKQYYNKLLELFIQYKDVSHQIDYGQFKQTVKDYFKNQWSDK